jgi:hypothetical protein
MSRWRRLPKPLLRAHAAAIAVGVVCALASPVPAELGPSERAKFLADACAYADKYDVAAAKKQCAKGACGSCCHADYADDLQWICWLHDEGWYDDDGAYAEAIAAGNRKTTCLRKCAKKFPGCIMPGPGPLPGDPPPRWEERPKNALWYFEPEPQEVEGCAESPE